MVEFSINVQEIMMQTKLMTEIYNSINAVKKKVQDIGCNLDKYGLSDVKDSITNIEASLWFYGNKLKTMSTKLNSIIIRYKIAEANLTGGSILHNPEIIDILKMERSNKYYRAQANHDTVNTDEMTYDEYLEYRAENAVDETTRRVYEKYKDKNYKEKNDQESGVYNQWSNTINYNAEADNTNPAGRGKSYFHEFGHMVDDFSDWNDETSNDWSYDFGECLQSDFENYVDKVMTEQGYSTREEAYKYIKKWLGIDQGDKNGISDLLKGLSDGDIRGPYGHDDDYYNMSHIENEAFAHFFEAGMCTDSTKLDYIKEVFPTAYDEFHQMLVDDLG